MSVTVPVHEFVVADWYALPPEYAGGDVVRNLADIADAQAEPEEAIKAMRAREKNE